MLSGERIGTINPADSPSIPRLASLLLCKITSITPDGSLALPVIVSRLQSKHNEILDYLSSISEIFPVPGTSLEGFKLN